MRLAEVRLQERESLENALRRFKRKVQTEDIIKDVKRHSFYLSRGEAPGEASHSAEACSKKEQKIIGLNATWGRCCQAVAFLG